MPRIARTVIPGCPHHITQRGNNRQDVFFVDDDRRVYLEILKAQSDRLGLAVHGYCLMRNHIHLVATPQTPDSLANAVGRTHWLYTQYVNRLHGRSGHLWQNRFYSCGLDDVHFWMALAYVERNPVRAGIVRRAWRYPWSSASSHCGQPDKTGLLDLRQWFEMSADMDWLEVLNGPMETDRVSRLRLYTSRGRPLGSDKFISKLEALLGKRLRPLPVGRPKKKKQGQK
ncbi:MAG: transposase [Phycisphaerae bacterium]|nr:transposase [Phycisphaerae bacterium]